MPNTVASKNNIRKILNYNNDILTFDDLELNFAYYDSKQKALKIMMNTLYGESGNKISPFYILALAGGITTAGRYNLELIEKECNILKCSVKYGDTDSIYITIPENKFIYIDNQYYGGNISKLDYCNNLIKITFTEIKKINEIINKKLIDDNGTKYLRLNYEEVLFPAVLLSKKQYYGLPHISTFNFNINRKPFTRGLEMKKRGVSEVLKKMYTTKILNESLSIYNKKELMELVYDAIYYYYENKWELNDFIRSAIYKPKSIEEVLEGKGNKSVLEFAGRMKIKGEELNPFERFKYVIVEKYPIAHDYRGRKRDLRVGEKMELLENVKKYNMNIDKDYYMKSNIITQLARVLSYRNEFYVESMDDTDKEIKKANKKMVVKTVNHINNFIKKNQFYNIYDDVGVIKKAIFKKSESIIINKFSDIIDIDKIYITYLLKDWKLDVLKAYKELYDTTNSKSIRQISNYGSEFIKFAIKLNKKKKKKERKEENKITNHLTKIYNNREYMNIYENFKEKYINKSNNDFRDMFESIMIISTEYRDSLSTMSYIIEKILKPIIDQFHKPPDKLNSLVNKYKKMSIDDMFTSLGKEIPYDFLNDMAEDIIYNLMKNNSIIDNIKKLITIQKELLIVLNIYNQTINIIEALKILEDMKQHMTIIIHNKPEIIKQHKNDLIDETCGSLKDINFDV